MDIEQNQEKLMGMVVDKVLKKHNVKIEENDLTDEEKEEIKNVVENIKKDVERFLQNQNKTKTEKDFQNSPTVQQTTERVEPAPINKKRVFTQPNDVSAVRSFLNNRNKR